MRAPKAAATDALASAARQLQYALEQSTTIDEAFQKLYASADAQQTASLRQLGALLRAPSSDAAAGKGLRLSPYPTLAWLLRQTPAAERCAAPLFREFRRHQSFSTTTVAAVRSEFTAFLTYLGAVLGILMVVLVMYTVFILPQFRALYDGLGRRLPAPTALVFGGGAPFFALLLLFATGSLIAMSWFVFRLRRQLRRYRPMGAGYERLPLLGPVVLAYNQYIWLSYAGLLRAAGVPAAQALSIAGSQLRSQQAGRRGATGADSIATDRPGRSALDADLALAARLGNLEAEAQFQQDGTIDTFLEALARCRRRARIVLTACVYCLVATLVSAMYLPIFSLGAAI
jgi:hypothetical protein